MCRLVAEQRGSSQPAASQRASRVQPAASFTILRRLLLTQHRRRGSTLGDTALPCRYYRLPLPVEGAPLEEDFDAFVNILRVRRRPLTPGCCTAWRPDKVSGLIVGDCLLVCFFICGSMKRAQPCHFLSCLCPRTQQPIGTSRDATQLIR